MDALLAIGIGVGLASAAGVRAFLPFVLALVFAASGFFDPAEPYEGVTGGWENLRAVAPLAVLALAEIVLDKVKRVERGFNAAMVPVRMISGGLLAAALAPAASFVPLLVVGSVVAGVVAGLKVFLRPPARVASSGVSASFLSLVEDAVALVGGMVGFFVPLLPAAPVAFLLFFYARIRKRRGRKFGGLRILGD